MSGPPRWVGLGTGPAVRASVIHRQMVATVEGSHMPTQRMVSSAWAPSSRPVRASWRAVMPVARCWPGAGRMASQGGVWRGPVGMRMSAMSASVDRAGDGQGRGHLCRVRRVGGDLVGRRVQPAGDFRLDRLDVLGGGGGDGPRGAAVGARAGRPQGALRRLDGVEVIAAELTNSGAKLVGGGLCRGHA